jgi:hypothetical protein
VACDGEDEGDGDGVGVGVDVCPGVGGALAGSLSERRKTWASPGLELGGGGERFTATSAIAGRKTRRLKRRT